MMGKPIKRSQKPQGKRKHPLIEAYLSRAQTQLTEAEQLPALTDGGLA